ncbi:MAG: ABC transporter permease [Gammaproteobacteria bacterium]|nr:ABC transporter permease [Gammaproteobacteria bacterium]
MSELRNDLWHAARSLARDFGLTTAAIVTVALGIGINAGIFMVLNGVLLRDLPAGNARGLVSIAQSIGGVEDVQISGRGVFSTVEYQDYRARARTLSGLAAYANAPRATLAAAAPREVFGTLVSCDFFDVLERPPVLGRALAATDCEPAAEPVIVLGHALWTRAFAADPGIVGQAVTLSRRSFTVVGVAAEATYSGPFTAAYFAPIGVEPLRRTNLPRLANDHAFWLNLIGRRDAEASVEHVRAELAVIAARRDRLTPGRTTALSVARATPSGPFPRASMLAAATLLQTAFGLVLLIACANVANLLLARGTARTQEIAIRQSLGATRGRIVRQLMSESLLLAVAGGVLGSLLALWAFQALVAILLPALLPPDLPELALDVSPDWRVLVFALLLTFGTTLAFGLAPALIGSKPDLHAVIRQDSAGAGGSRGGGRIRGVLVCMQVALGMALMIAAGLLLRGVHATYTSDVGFTWHDVSYVSLESWLDGRDAAEVDDLMQRLREQVAALPGIASVAYTDQEPLGDDSQGIAVRLPTDASEAVLSAQLENVSPEYFSLLEIPLVRGRTFTADEVERRGSGTRAAIVSATTARNLWPGGDPIGATLLWDELSLHIVGVVADAQVSAPGRIDPHYVYLPAAGGSTLLLKSRLDFAATAAAVRGVIQRLDPTLATNVYPLAATLDWWRGLSRSLATLGTVLGVLALVLAVVGVYGVVAYAVTKRHREIGIRMALGAGTRAILVTILLRTLRPTAIGAALGIAAAAALTRVLSNVLFGVSPADPIAFAGAIAIVIGTTLAAGLLATRSVTRTNPTIMLRTE